MHYKNLRVKSLSVSYKFLNSCNLFTFVANDTPSMRNIKSLSVHSCTRSAMYFCLTAVKLSQLNIKWFAFSISPQEHKGLSIKFLA